MIYTITLNPAIDYYIKGKKAEIIAGGKGINVSRALNRLKIDNIALGFYGGNTGDVFIDLLKEENIKHNLFLINEDTRVNLKLLIDNKNVNELNTTGPSISDKDILKLYDLLKNLNESDIVIISGRGIKSNPKIYESIAKICSDKKIKFIVDTTKNELFDTLKYKPILVKPNLKELIALYQGNDEPTMNQIIDMAKNLLNRGAQNVIVSLDKSGSIFIHGDKVYYSEPKELEVIRTVGAGDNMIAGFVYGLLNKKEYIDCYKLGVAVANEFVHNKNYDLESVMKELETIKIIKK